MTIKQLRYFITVADCENVTKAAKICNVTQPTISLQIKVLEKSLGVQLLKHRSGRGNDLVVTEIGESVLKQARNVLLESSKITELINKNR